MKKLSIVIAIFLFLSNAAKAATDFTDLLNLTADKIQFNEQTGELTATGNLFIRQGNNTLIAEKIVYHTVHKTVDVTGPMQLVFREGGGVIVSAQRAQMNEALTDGLLEDVQILYQDNAQISTDQARLKNGRLIIVHNVTYTPCLHCEDERPLWQIDAGKVVYDRERRIVQYRNAKMRMKGVPFLYTPYLAHPDPTVKHKSGLLPPRLGSSQELGFIFGLPVFWAITPQNDFTFTPIFTEEEGAVFSGTYKHRFSNGRIDIDATGTENREGDFRNYLKAEGSFNITDVYRTAFTIDRASDQTFLKTYGINRDPPAWLESSFNIERIKRQHYVVAEAVSFQDLRLGFLNRTTPYVAPRVFLWDKTETFFGGSLIVESDFLNLRRAEGNSVIRSANTISYVQPLNGFFGDYYTITGAVKGDAYNVDDYLTPAGDTYDGNQYRVNPSLHVTGGIPLIQSGRFGSQIIEPVFSFYTAGRTAQKNIPDNDSTDFELDDTNILSASRFSGRDILDTNTRVAYGLNWAFYPNNFGRLSAFIAQSYSIDNGDIYPAGTGLDDDFSHYVGRVSADLTRHLTVSYRFRMSHKKLTFLRNELDIESQFGPVKMKLDFIDLASAEGLEGRREIGIESEVAVTKSFSVGGYVRRDLGRDGGTRKAGGNLFYEDECFKMLLGVSKDFTTDRDFQGGLSIGLGIEFKTLGGFRSQRSLF